jgi:nucleotide-binding universal stress UspA family protein
MKSIIVATDFSVAATNAANYAADMATSIHADLLLLHIYTIPVGFNETPVMINPQEWKKDAEADINRLKDELMRRTGGKIEIRTEIVMGTFFQELKTVCDEVHPYAVVMGSQGTTKAERLLFGGHTVYAMKHIEYPLITVPPDAKFTELKNIGLACDFENVADAIPVEELRLLMQDFKGRLHIVNTGKKDTYEPGIVSGTALLKHMLGSLQPEFHFITAEHIDEGIMNFTEQNKIDLLIVLPKRHSLLEKLIHRSQTKQLVLHSHVPVMALHQ